MSPKSIPKRRGSIDASSSPLEERKTPSKGKKSSKSSQKGTPPSTSRRSTRSTPTAENAPNEARRVEPCITETPQQAKNASRSLTREEKNPVDIMLQTVPASERVEYLTSCSELDTEKKSSGKKSADAVNDKSHLATVDTPQPPSPHKRRKSSKSKAMPIERSPLDETTLKSESPMICREDPSHLKQSDGGSIALSKPAPTMDVAVHRLRNFDYHPKPILCMASIVLDAAASYGDSLVEESVLPDSLIAVSRESGSIELQTVHPKWHTVSVVAGRSDSPITSLAWVTVKLSSSVSNDTSAVSMTRPALIGVHRHDLYIVDFWGSGQLSSKHSCPGGSIFALQPLRGNLVATGSQDGSIRIYSVVASSSTSESGKKRILFHFQQVSTIPTAGEAVLSLAFMASQANEDSLPGTVIYAGIADGTIRRYDCYQSTNVFYTSATARATSHFSTPEGTMWKSTLRMTVECYGRTSPTRVWTMKALSDGTLVSGDSLGHVQFWDGNIGALIFSFEQNDSKADVLALAVAADECKVFASGVDSRVVCIERRSNVEASATNVTNTQWILTQAQRPHTHDVKAMTILKKFKISQNRKIMKKTEIMFTGGIDTKLCTYHVLEFGLRRPRVLYPWPSLRSPILMANEARLLTMLREDRIDLYELAAAPKSPEHFKAPIVASELEVMLGSIQIKGISNLVSSAISPRGTFLAVTDSYSVYLFHVQFEAKKRGKRNVVTSRISLHLPEACSIVAMHFVQEDSLILVFSDDSIRMFTILKQDDEFETSMTQTLQHSTKRTDPLCLLFPIHSVVASKDGIWIATGRNNYHQNDGHVHIYRRTPSGFQFWWTLPTLISAVTTFAFLEIEGDPFLTVACIDFAWYTFDLANRRLSDWSVKAGYPMPTSKLPAELAARNDFPIRIGSNPASPSLVLIVSFVIVFIPFAGFLLPCARCVVALGLSLPQD
jgi:U3 small nucleolar RNA-associated protein 4